MLAVLAVPPPTHTHAPLPPPSGVSSVLAVLAGALLPGDWGFFTSYLVGGVSLAVLAVGSTAPGLLQVPSSSVPHTMC